MRVLPDETKRPLPSDGILPDDLRECLALADFQEFDSESTRRMKYCDVTFQRRFSDARGTRYFLTLFGYQPGVHRHPNWQWMMDLHTSEPHFVLERHGILENTDTLFDWMQSMEALWECVGSPYYEID